MDFPSLFHIAHAASETATTPEGGVLGMFGVNWKSFIAQLINFAIILFVCGNGYLNRLPLD